MATSIVGARVVLGSPTVQHYGGEVRLTIPVMNVGEVGLANVRITSITLGTAARTSPPGFPIVIGPLLGASTSSPIAARFAGAGIAPGSNLLLIVRGSYTLNGTALGLTLSRYVRVPAAGALPPGSLLARISTSVATNFWNYSITNLEAAGSSQRIAAFSVQLAGPATVTATPAGWVADTDNSTYVLWIAADPGLPYPNHVAPGATLAGFQLMSARTASEASGASVVGWDHATDQAGFVFADYALVPAR